MEAPTTSTIPSSKMLFTLLLFSAPAVARIPATDDPTLSLCCRRDERRTGRPVYHTAAVLASAVLQPFGNQDRSGFLLLSKLTLGGH